MFLKHSVYSLIEFHKYIKLQVNKMKSMFLLLKNKHYYYKKYIGNKCVKTDT